MALITVNRLLNCNAVILEFLQNGQCAVCYLMIAVGQSAGQFLSSCTTCS